MPFLVMSSVNEYSSYMRFTNPTRKLHIATYTTVFPNVQHSHDGINVCDGISCVVQQVDISRIVHCNNLLFFKRGVKKLGHQKHLSKVQADYAGYDPLNYTQTKICSPCSNGPVTRTI